MLAGKCIGSASTGLALQEHYAHCAYANMTRSRFTPSEQATPP